MRFLKFETPNLKHLDSKKLHQICIMQSILNIETIGMNLEMYKRARCKLLSQSY